MSMSSLLIALVGVVALVSSEAALGETGAAPQPTLALRLRRIRKLRENAFYGDTIPYGRGPFRKPPN